MANSGALTVLDLSPEMLKMYCPDHAIGVVGDVYEHEFPAESFDSIVFPLMLHHTPRGSWRSCEARIEEVLDRIKPWLRKGGHVFVLEYCPHPAWSPVQRALLPLTKAFLARMSQPLVVMYTRAFYQRVLDERFGSFGGAPGRSQGVQLLEVVSDLHVDAMAADAPGAVSQAPCHRRPGSVPISRPTGLRSPFAGQPHDRLASGRPNR